MILGPADLVHFGGVHQQSAQLLVPPITIEREALPSLTDFSEAIGASDWR